MNSTYRPGVVEDANGPRTGLQKGVAFIINFVTGGLARQGWCSVNARPMAGAANQAALGARFRRYYLRVPGRVATFRFINKLGSSVRVGGMATRRVLDLNHLTTLR